MGFGGREVCLGIQLAYLELRHAMALFYRTFESGVKPSVTEGFSKEDMAWCLCRISSRHLRGRGVCSLGRNRVSR